MLELKDFHFRSGGYCHVYFILNSRCWELGLAHLIFLIFVVGGPRSEHRSTHGSYICLPMGRRILSTVLPDISSHVHGRCVPAQDAPGVHEYLPPAPGKGPVRPGSGGTVL